MSALKKTDHAGKIVWLGVVKDREAALRSSPLSEMVVTFAGPPGEDHGGLTRRSCSRVITQYKRGTEIRNTRQLSILSAEELAEIATRMGLDRIDPAWLGASVVVSGVPDFSHIPPSSRLQAPHGATLTVDMQNRPCHLPAPVIDAEVAGAGAKFKSAAQGRRGVTAWVEREGVLRLGHTVSVHVPDQRAWAGF